MINTARSLCACLLEAAAPSFLVPHEDEGRGRFFVLDLGGTDDEVAPETVVDASGRLLHAVGFLRQCSWMLICNRQQPQSSPVPLSPLDISGQACNSFPTSRIRNQAPGLTWRSALIWSARTCNWALVITASEAGSPLCWGCRCRPGARAARAIALPYCRTDDKSHCKQKMDGVLVCL